MPAAAIVALLIMHSTPSHDPAPVVLAQITQSDPAHTLITPNAPDSNRVGQPQQLPGGGIGTSTGGTSHYQTLQTPGGGTALAVPNGAGSSIVTAPGGRTGIVTAPH